ncbi:1-aminocyclopropane-1-carboxylate deaminase/D-cysteine desulfhydrase [Thalassolituus sp. LLYu03]|uniref:1-aminocyclopropane-1-carboxylate deaminase/D-cysteine desulfhydrase n=1 Tax=Thalassolituus sp. LLYu03 TaxID=3421656 RepID=UPI003D2A68F7
MLTANFIDALTSPRNLASLPDPWPESGLSCQADVLRLDRLHPQFSGNKPFKLIGHLDAFASSGKRALLSFGGVWSNHLHALAALGQQTGIPVVLVVRGYAHLPLTPTLRDCADWGAQLVFVDKATYRRRYEPSWQAELADEYDALVIPEGGGSDAGLSGCRRLASVCAHYDEVWLACGTGTTALGIAQGLNELDAATTVVGVNAVADQGFLSRHWSSLMPGGINWRVIDDAHGGGFGKVSPAHLALIHHFDALHLPLDPVYTVKLVAAFLAAEKQGLNAGKRILLVHSGGLQGRRGGGLDLPLT